MDRENSKKMLEMAKRANDERYANNSKEQLKRAITTKFKTTMIGSLSVFEDLFGYLWGHGKDPKDLTKTELEFKRSWDIARTDVLNNGNNQMRAVLQEVDGYTVKWNKLTTDFIIKPKD